MSVQISYKKQTAFFILSLIVVLAVLESGSRIYEYIQPDCFLIGADATKNLGTELQNQMCEEIDLLKSNEYPVFENEPNQHLTTININSLGFRGPEFDLIKNDNTYRIMMLGGSTAFGAGASSDATTIPAYLADIFGTQHVGAIHGRLLTAWSTAGIIGPMLISYLREYQLSQGIPPEQAYNSSFKILALLLVVGFILNLLIKPVNKKFFMTEKQLKAEQISIENKKEKLVTATTHTNKALQSFLLPIAWLVVSVPIGWGILNALQKGIIIFQ